MVSVSETIIQLIGEDNNDYLIVSCLDNKIVLLILYIVIIKIYLLGIHQNNVIV